MKLIEWVKGIFREKRFRRKEYLYLFITKALSYNDTHDTFEPLKHEFNERKQIIEYIGKLSPIKFTDSVVSPSTYETTMLLGTDDPKTNLFMQPLVYEIYAYKTKKDKTIFTYSYETLLFKINNEDLEILKFVIEC